MCVLHRVAVCCSVLQCVAVTDTLTYPSYDGRVVVLSVCCSVYSCVAACCSVLQSLTLSHTPAMMAGLSFYQCPTRSSTQFFSEGTTTTVRESKGSLQSQMCMLKLAHMRPRAGEAAARGLVGVPSHKLRFLVGQRLAGAGFVACLGLSLGAGLAAVLGADVDAQNHRARTLTNACVGVWHVRAYAL